MRSKLDKFKHVSESLYRGGVLLYTKGAGPTTGDGALYGGTPREQTDWQTHTTENITFPQLRWRAVTSTLSIDLIGIEEENANRGTKYNIYEMDLRLSVLIIIPFYTPLLSGHIPLFDCEYFLLLLSRSIFLPCAATGICDSVQGGGACVAGGGHAWQGACMVGGMHGRGHVWQGGMHDRGHVWWGHAWQGVHAWQGACVVGACMGKGACVAGGYAWQGACVVGACMGEGACVAGGMCG